MTGPRFSCAREDCTAALTGHCLESHDNPAECPHASAGVASAIESASLPVVRRFHAGHELGLRDALTVSRARYAHLVALLGVSDAGKTCFLTSLYLNACHGLLAPDYRFAGSLTLQGLELRARGLRSWNKDGSLPEQVTEHTALADPRTPAFVHLALDSSSSTHKRIELLLSDLPGEWTSQLVDRADKSSKFDFVARADSVMIALHGPRLAANATKHQDVAMTKQLFERLKQNVNLGTDIPIVLLVTRIDELNGDVPDCMRDLERHARDVGYLTKTIGVASISRFPKRIVNGTGVREAVHALLAAAPGMRQSPHVDFGEKPMRSYLLAGGRPTDA
jgi:hypothetical protein